MAKKDFSVTEDVRKAVKSFWRIKRHQFRKSNDPSNRGAVVAGKQMDGFQCLSIVTW